MTGWSLPPLISPPPLASNTEGQEGCTLRAKVLKVVKSNDSICWRGRADVVQPCAWSPLFEDTVLAVVSFYNDPNGYGWKWWCAWWRSSFHKAIMAVTCHLGQQRGFANSSEGAPTQRKKRRVRGCIKTIRDAGLRRQPWAPGKEQAERWRRKGW